jgi:hypothetical protein
MWYQAQFLDAFGAGPGRTIAHIDAAGHALPIGPAMFAGPGALATDQRNLLLIADALKSPDEIWLRWDKTDSAAPQLVRRYLRQTTIANQPWLSVIDWSQSGWRATAMPLSNDHLPAHYRVGAPQYRPKAKARANAKAKK